MTTREDTPITAALTRTWFIPPEPADSATLARQLGVNPLVGRILCNRGIGDPDAARRFLNPRMADLIPPEALCGCEAAATVVLEAIRAGRSIVIYGDYDVDGIAASAILWRCLTLAGAKVDFYVPHRLEEGYGLNAEAIDKLADDGDRKSVV